LLTADEIAGISIFAGLGPDEASKPGALARDRIGGLQGNAETGWLPPEMALDRHGFVLTGSDVRAAGRWE
jgi:hypothetical protein